MIFIESTLFLHYFVKTCTNLCKEVINKRKILEKGLWTKLIDMICSKNTQVLPMCFVQSSENKAHPKFECEKDIELRKI